MKDKNGREINDGDKLRLASGTEVGYEFDDRPDEPMPHYIGPPFQSWLTESQAAIVLHGCEVVRPLEFEGKVDAGGQTSGYVEVPKDSGIKPGDTVVVRVKK